MIVLCYHAANIDGNDYSTNDHIALAADLATIHRLGLEIVPAHAAVGITLGKPTAPGSVALTFDDGISLDAHDFVHPAHGPQPGFATILREHCARTGQLATASSFVIASPTARRELDEKAFLGLGIWGDDWWKQVCDEGLISIENHSLDHNHPVLETTYAPDGSQGSFLAVSSDEHCCAQVVSASDYIEQRCGRRPKLFAYPWGQGSDRLRREFLPSKGRQAGLIGAFSIDPGPVTESSDPWWLPRFVCGQHWRRADELEALLVAHS